MIYIDLRYSIRDLRKRQILAIANILSSQIPVKIFNSIIDKIFNSVIDKIFNSVIDKIFTLSCIGMAPCMAA